MWLPFTLPSSRQQIKLNQDFSVEVALDISATAVEAEERALSNFLNQVQHEKSYCDAREWTIEDRKAALAYLFFHTHDETKQAIQYDCNHCGETHSTIVDYLSLVDSYQEIEGKAERTITFQDQEVRVRPLQGKHAEEIELRQLDIQSKADDSASQTKAKVELSLYRLSALIQWQEEEIKALSYKAFIELLHKVQEALSELKHGLQFRIVHACPNKEAAETEIELPFQTNHYLPRVFTA